MQKELIFQEANSNTLFKLIRTKEVELYEFVNELEETKRIEILELKIKQLRMQVNQKKLDKYNELEIKKYKDLLIGYSDHSGSIYACLAAAALGSKIFEFHVVFDKMMFGPDSSSSL